MRALARSAVLLAALAPLALAGPAQALKPKKNRFVVTRGGHQKLVKAGTTIDARRGTVKLAARLGSATRSARVSKGRFVPRQKGSTVTLTLVKGGISCKKPYGKKGAKRALRVKAGVGFATKACFALARRSPKKLPARRWMAVAAAALKPADWTTTDTPGKTTVKATKGPVRMQRTTTSPPVDLGSGQDGSLGTSILQPDISGDGTGDDPNGDLKPCTFPPCQEVDLAHAEVTVTNGKARFLIRAYSPFALHPQVIRGIWPVLEVSRWDDGFSAVNDRDWDVDPRDGQKVAVIDRHSPFGPGCPGHGGCQTGTGTVTHPSANVIAYTVPLSAFGGASSFRWIAAEFQCDYDDRVPDSGSISFGDPPPRPGDRKVLARAAC